LLGACLAGSLFCCGYVFGQQAPEPNPTRYKLGSADIAMKIAYLGGNTDGKAEQALHEVLLDAGRKADVAAIVTDYSVYKLSEARSKAKGAVQVSEAADVEALRLRIVEVHQNARIIELLEQIAKK
jgi:hypothetical protein